MTRDNGIAMQEWVRLCWEKATKYSPLLIGDESYREVWSVFKTANDSKCGGIPWVKRRQNRIADM